MSQRWLAAVLCIFGIVACQPNRAPIEVSEVWGPEVPAVAQNGIFYLQIRNHSQADDRLVAVQSPGCTTAELHETYENEHGLMGMRYLADGLFIPAGETVMLDVGGFHIMCLGKTAEFRAGEQIPLTLTFAAAGELTVEAEIH